MWPWRAVPRAPPMLRSTKGSLDRVRSSGSSDGRRPLVPIGPGCTKPGSCCYVSSPSPNRARPMTSRCGWLNSLGFDAFFRSDHFMVMGDSDGLPGPTDAWITLAGIARETSRIRLGTLVTSATFRLPGLLAVTVAEVDAMSHGRVELGLGSGWFDTEHTAYGVP